jgi:UDP-2,3-diacylglucosamine pyrophosphatase LpxH
LARPAGKPPYALLWFARLLCWLAALLSLAIAVRWAFLRFRRVILQPTEYTTPPIPAESVTPRLRRIIVSDLHLGAGDRLDDFTSDAAFAAFVHHYVCQHGPTELILAGDTLEFLQVRLPDIDDHTYSNAAAERRAQVIIAAHDQVFAALREFVQQAGSQLTVLIGNHDFELHYPAAKAAFRQGVGLAEDDPRLRFGLNYQGGGLYLVHGNQFDGWNRFVYFAGISEPFEVVRGTQMVKEVINELEDEPLEIAHLIDNVKPTSAFVYYMIALPRLRKRVNRRYVTRGVLGFLQVVIWPTPHQMPITGRGPGGWLSQPIFLGVWRWIARQRQQRVERNREVARAVGNVAGQVDPPPEVLDQVEARAAHELRREVRDFNDRFVREMAYLARMPAHASTKFFICGHTHGARFVPISESQYYINTGTWIEIVYDVATMRRQEQRHPFLEVTYPDGDEPQARLLVWLDDEEPPAAWQEGPEPRRRPRLLGYRQD